MPKAASIGTNLLVIEDNIGDARLLSEILKDTDFSKHELTYVQNLDDIQQMATLPYQAILLDLHLSHTKPLDTFQRVNELYPKTPIIVLTGLEDDELAAKVVRLGAQDYLIKGTFDGDSLQRSLKYAIYRKNSERKIATERRKSKKLQFKAEQFELETKRLAEINKAKDVFLSIASHQLRTPATAVKQYVGMVLHGFVGDVTDKQRGFLETAYQSNERQLKIVDDLLKVARLDAGHVTLHKSPTDIIGLVSGIIADQAESISIKKQQVLFDPDRPSIVVDIDADNMRMVLENLLDNASKYSGEGAEVMVSVMQHGPWVTCAIKDEGIGISKEDQKKLFQKFSRVDDSFVHAPNGSGLGLYWAREIVKLHDGEIALRSAKGKGSTFEVRIPA
jgi:signal transduction histidine kinase